MVDALNIFRHSDRIAADSRRQQLINTILISWQDDVETKKERDLVTDIQDKRKWMIADGAEAS